MRRFVIQRHDVFLKDQLKNSFSREVFLNGFNFVRKRKKTIGVRNIIGLTFFPHCKTILSLQPVFAMKKERERNSILFY